MSTGPRSTEIFLVLTGILFAVLLVALGWRANLGGTATWILGAGVVVAVLSLILAVFLARGVDEGRL